MPYQLFHDHVNCAEPWWQSDATDALLDIYDGWFAKGGSAEAKQRGENRYRIELESELNDLNNDGAGALSAHGTFERCEVSWSGEFPMFL